MSCWLLSAPRRGVTLVLVRGFTTLFALSCRRFLHYGLFGAQARIERHVRRRSEDCARHGGGALRELQTSLLVRYENILSILHGCRRAVVSQFHMFCSLCRAAKLPSL